MQLILDSMQAPVNNLLGIFLQLFLLIILTMVMAILLLLLIPNKFSRRVKNAIIGSVTFTVLIIWVYIVILSRFS